MYKKILVPLDGSPLAEAALPLKATPSHRMAPYRIQSFPLPKTLKLT